MAYKAGMQWYNGADGNRYYKYVSPEEAEQANLLAAQREKLAKQTWQKVTPNILQTEGQKAAESYIQNAMNTDQTFADRTASNEYADRIKSELNSYLSSSANNPLLQSAQSELQKTLAGDYDPNTSQYYQGMRQSMDLNLNDAMNKYKQSQYLKGNLRSTATDAGQGRMLAENTAAQNTLLGNLANQERQNRLAAVGQAQSLAGAQQTYDTNRLNTLTTTSDYLTQQNQKAKDAAYEQWKANLERKNSLAQLLYTTPVTYAYDQYQLM